MRVKVQIEGFVDIPDRWGRTAEGFDPMKAWEVADYRYNDQLDEEDTLIELANKLIRYREELVVQIDLV